MRTLVLGGTGFVGRRLVEVLIADGTNVTVLNRGVTPVELPDGVERLLARRVGRYVYVSSQSLYQMTGAFPWREAARSWPPTSPPTAVSRSRPLSRAR